MHKRKALLNNKKLFKRFSGFPTDIMRTFPVEAFYWKSDVEVFEKLWKDFISLFLNHYVDLWSGLLIRLHLMEMFASKFNFSRWKTREKQ